MVIEGQDLIGYLPNQPPAGKLEYTIVLMKNDRSYIVNEVPVVIRFKESVPKFVLIPHILFIFTAQLLSLVAGLFAVYRLRRYKLYGILTIIFLFVGGFVLGPVIQKYAFGAFWTGFPFGQDMTDNKVLVALLFWILAVVMNIRKDRPTYAWIAALVFFLVNMIPHSMFGSELDYETGVVNTGMIMFF
jgi:FtsH-binding integral membrane protein